LSLIEVKKKILMAQGGGLDISKLFATTTYTGSGVARSIVNGLDLAGDGGLVISQSRNGTTGAGWIDSARGAFLLDSSTAVGGERNAPGVMTFTSNGYDLGDTYYTNVDSTPYVSWAFKKTEGFFDTVTYTGDGVAGRTVAHSLGVKPSFIVVRRRNLSADWQVYSDQLGATYYGTMSSAAFALGTNRWNNTEPTAVDFTVGPYTTSNTEGAPYVAWLFADNPSGIKSGTYTGTDALQNISVGWEPQFVLIKSILGGTGNWVVFDEERGMNSSNDPALFWNLNTTEVTSSPENWITTNSTGFSIDGTNNSMNDPARTYMYLAIRKAA
jgi:hypothetical protein